ncbi:MAG: hypothetical protein IJX02_01850 [Clostridia bacterium]|nr:hypothetical protein [Clostridia bacterium]
MNNKLKPLTGVFKSDNKNYAFYLDNYCITFLDNTTDTHTNSTIKPIDEFAKGTTHNGHTIMIHIGKNEFHLVNTMKLNFSSYILSTSNTFDYDLSFYDGILFVGGTIKNLKSPRGIKINYDDDTKRSYIEHNDDSQEFSFKTSDYSCDVTIGSSTSEHHGKDSIAIKNDKVYFQMLFDKRQPTLSVYKHYNKVKEILSFLTYRQNVGFDEVYLMQRNTPIGTTKVAQVFIKNSDKLTEKDIFKNLKFDLLGSNMSNLMKMFYETQDKKKSYSLDIYPESDEMETIITNEMVRGVCSALECEIDFVKGVKSDEATKIKALKKQIQPIIDAHKKSDEKLLEKTYSLIETSMQHWSMAASDQIKSLYHIYEEEMNILNFSYHTYGDDEIDAFVKYRNHITHGAYRVMDGTIAFMTHLLAGLVYCCILARIGMPREQITKLCKDGRLLG